jgi:hypothetical protein
MRKWLVLSVIAALVLGACSNEPSAEEDPKAALVSAFEEIGKLDASTVRISLQSTPESLAAASEGDLSPEQADIILGSAVTISGQQTDDPEEQNARFAVEVPGTDGVEVLVIGTDFYIRADVRGIVELAGEDPSQIDAFLESPQAQQAPFLEAAANGEFIKIEVADQLGAAAGANPGAITEQQQKLLEEFGKSIQEEATVTSEGSDDVGDRLSVSIPLQSLVDQFTEFAGQLGTVPPGTLPSEEEIPEGDVTMDVWVSDGRVVQLEFDVVALAQEFEGDVPEGVEDLRIRIELSEEAEEVTAPEGATTVTAQELMGLIFGGLGGGLDEGSGGEFTEPGTDETPGGDDLGGGELDCSIYDGLPPETFDGLPQETLDQLEQLCPGLVPN